MAIPAGVSRASNNLRCAPWTRAQGLDPIGTAGYARAMLTVEWPLPWPSRIDDIPELGRLLEATGEAGVQIQALVPEGSDRGKIGVTAYRSSWAGGFDRVEATVARTDLVEGVLTLLAEPAAAEPGDGAPSSATEVLICAHGRRDRCCGSFGTQLATRLSKGDPFDGHVRVRRTSHTGGHRFAPTGILLPQGTAWAFLDEESLFGIVSRSGDLEKLLPQYRGYLGLESPQLQALEREVVYRIGWSVFDMGRTGEDLGGHRYRIRVQSPNGEASVWEGTVVATRSLPVPVCGAPIEDAVKSQTELAVHDVVQVR